MIFGDVVRIPILPTLLCGLFCVVPCNAEPSFVGFIVDGSRILLAIRERPDSGSRWVSVGDRVGPYLVESFDRSAGSATLRLADTRLILHLPQSRVTPRVDISDIEALAAGGNRRLASLLNSYRQIEVLRDRMNTALATDEGYEARQSKARQKMDVMLSSLMELMHAEAAKLPSPNK